MAGLATYHLELIVWPDDESPVTLTARLLRRSLLLLREMGEFS